MSNTFSGTQVFISYSRRDTEFVKKLDESLKQEGLEVWVDWEDIPLSANWMEEIEAGIEGADVFVFVISPDSLASEVCRKELNYAMMRNKRFIPVLYRETKDTQSKLPSIIATHNWIFFRDTDDYASAFTGLIDTIQSDFEHMRQHTRLLVRATEWETSQWDNDFLLTGSELQTAQAWLTEALKYQKQPIPTDSHKLFIDNSCNRDIRNKGRMVAIVSSVIVFGALAVALFFLWRSSEENRVAAQQSAAEAREARQVAEEQRESAIVLAQENIAINNSMSLALHAETIAEDGDSYSALPFAIAAYDAQNTAFAEVSLSNIALSPSAMAWLLDHTTDITDIATHPSEQIVVTASRDDTLIIWDLTTQPPTNLHQLDGHGSDVRAVDFSPDGQLIASGSNAGDIILWDANTGDMARVLVPVDDSLSVNVDQLAFSPNGQYLLASVEDLRGGGTGDDVHELRIYEVESGDLVQMVGAEGYSAGSIAFSPDGSQFLAGFTTGEIYIWDFTPDAETYNDLAGTVFNPPEDAVEFPDPVARLREHQAGNLITDLNFNAEGTQLLSSSADFDIILWDWVNLEVIHLFDGHTDTVQAVDFIAGKNQALSTGRDRNVIIWDLDTGLALHVMTGHESLPQALAVTYDGAFGITGATISGLGVVWDLNVVNFANDYNSLTDEVRRVVYHPDGDLAATLSLDLPPNDNNPTLRLWRPATGEVIQEFPNHTAGGFDLAFVLDNSAIVTALGSELSLWDIETGEAIQETITGNNTSIWDIDPHPDGVHVIGATNGGDLLLWNMQTRELEDTFLDVNEGVRLLTVQYNPDDPNQVFISSNRFLLTYDLTARQVLHYFEGHTESIVGMAVNGEENLLVTTDFRRDVYVRNYETQELLTIMTFHTSTVWGVDIDPSGRFVASAAENGEVLLWDLERNALVRRFDGYGQRIRSVAFSPDGQSLLFGESDLHHIRLYSANELLEWIEQYRVMDTVTCAEQTGDLIINPECDPEQNRPQRISAGRNFSGSIHMEAAQEWRYEGVAGEVITISVTADNSPPIGFAGFERRRAAGYLDTIVTIFNTDSEVLAYNDDVQDGVYNSEIPNVTLPADGVYSIIVESYEGGSYGGYTIHIEQVSVPEPVETEE